MTGQTIEHSVSVHWQIIESKICIYQLSANYDLACIYTVILLLWNQSGECQIRCEVWVPPQKENTNSSKYISWDMHHPPACCVFIPICVLFVVYSYFIFAVFVFQVYSYCIFAVFVFVVYSYCIFAVFVFVVYSYCICCIWLSLLQLGSARCMSRLAENLAWQTIYQAREEWHTFPLDFFCICTILFYTFVVWQTINPEKNSICSLLFLF